MNKMEKTRIEEILNNAIFHLIKIRASLGRDRDYSEWQAAVDAIGLLEHALKEVKSAKNV